MLNERNVPNFGKLKIDKPLFNFRRACFMNSGLWFWKNESKKQQAEIKRNAEFNNKQDEIYKGIGVCVDEIKSSHSASGERNQYYPE